MQEVLVTMLLASIQGMAFALAGVAVRTQLSLYQAFDFIIAALVLVGAETFVAASTLGHGGILLTTLQATVVAVAVCVLAAIGWNLLVTRIWPGAVSLSAVLFVGSLGVSTMCTGLVGLARGPGLRQPANLQATGESARRVIEALTSFYFLALGLLVLIVVLAWRKRKSGVALELLAQNPRFAQELGITRRSLAVPCGVIVGLLTAAVGCHFAIVGGSTPGIGLPAFLYGAGSALLLPVRLIWASIVGGMVLGGLHVGVQLFLSPAFANLTVFLLVAVLLAYRGSSRTAQRVR